MKKNRIAAAILAGTMIFSSAPEIIPQLTVAVSAASKLSAPKSFKAKSKTKNSVTLTWKKVSGATAYRIFKYEPSSGKYNTYKVVTGTTCKVTGLKPETLYKFRIAALTGNNGKYKTHNISSVLSVATKAESTAPLAAPSNIKYESTATTITCSWDAVKKADAYGVYVYNYSTYQYDKITTVTDTKYTLTQLHPGSEYKVKIATLKDKTIGYEEHGYAERLFSTKSLAMSTTPMEFVEPEPGARIEQVLEHCGIANYIRSTSLENGAEENVYNGEALFNGIRGSLEIRFNNDGQCTGYTCHISANLYAFNERVEKLKERYGSYVMSYTDSNGNAGYNMMRQNPGVFINLVFDNRTGSPFYTYITVYSDYLKK